MKYLYTQANRINEPHHYMYTPFGGVPFLCAYRDDRRSILGRIYKKGEPQGDAQYESATYAYLCDAGWERDCTALGSTVSHLNHDAVLGQLAEGLQVFSITEMVSTAKLLEALLASQLSGGQEEPIKYWLDRLVQRFEVTKKTYERYLPGFRKGEGSSESVRLYWLLALALCLFFAKTRHLKYLSTLLKVNDLLASLSDEVCFGHISSGLMSVIFEVELSGVEGLATAKEVAFEA